MTRRLDALIIGSGPAGIACALELRESRREFLVLEKSPTLGANLLEIKNTIRNFAGGYFDSGDEYRRVLENLSSRFKLNVKLGCEVEQIRLDHRAVSAGGKEYTAETVVLAMGCGRRRLNLRREPEFVSDVFYVVEGYEKEFVNQSVAVVGGGDSALFEALELSSTARQVYLIHRGDSFRARPSVVAQVESNERIEVLLESTVASLDGTTSLESITVARSDGAVRALTVNKLVAKIGYAPNTEMVKGQVNLDQAGHIVIDEHCRTSCPRVFAVGDVTSPAHLRIAAAAGQGAVAALSIRALVEEPD